jgi:hypothetical protein
MGSETGGGPLSVKVDFGIAEVIRAVDQVLERRRRQRNQTLADFGSNLSETLDATGKAVRALDDIFIRLIAGFADSEITHDGTRLKGHVAETRKYLRERNLLPKLEECIGAVKSDSLDGRLKAREYRDLVSALRSLASRLQSVRDSLGKGALTGVGQMEQWNLETLCEKATGCNYGGGKIADSLEEIAEEVRRNNDFDISDDISRLIGTIRPKAMALGH